MRVQSPSSESNNSFSVQFRDSNNAGSNLINNYTVVDVGNNNPLAVGADSRLPPCDNSTATTTTDSVVFEAGGDDDDDTENDWLLSESVDGYERLEIPINGW